VTGAWCPALLGCDRVCDCAKCIVDDAVVGPFASLFADDQAGVGQLFHVV
jgi:hypothetical protein